MDAVHAVTDCSIDCGRFGQHAIGKLRFVTQFFEPGPVDVRDQRLWIVFVFEDAWRARCKNQFLGVQLRGNRRG